MKPILAILLLSAAPALAQPTTGARAQGEAAARCAALWQGAALEASDHPAFAGTAPATEALAGDFAAQARAAGLSRSTLREVIVEDLPDARLLYRSVLKGDQQSAALFERRAAACAGLQGGS